MSSSPLVSAAELADHLDDPAWRSIDCRFDLKQPEAGEAGYHEGHIPGALYAHLDRDLSGPITPDSGRHPLPDPQRLRATFSTWGIDSDSQVICYDAHANAYAARLWWLLRWLGHERVAVLDGGLKAWEAGNYPFDTATPPVTPSTFRGNPHPDMLVTTQELATQFDSHTQCLIDVRTPERYRRREGTLRPCRRSHPRRAQPALSKQPGFRRVLSAAGGAEENVSPRARQYRAGALHRHVRIGCNGVSKFDCAGTGWDERREAVCGVVE